MASINAPHWHLLFNHLPVVGVMGGTLLLIYALARNNAELKRAALLSFILVGICAFIAHLTGDPAAEAVRDLPGISRQDIRAHDEASGIAMSVSLLLALVSIVGLVMGARKKDEVVAGAATPAHSDLTVDRVSLRTYLRYHKAPPMAVLIICLIISLVDVGLMLWVSNLGGQIRHPEIRNTAPGVPKST